MQTESCVFLVRCERELVGVLNRFQPHAQESHGLLPVFLPVLDQEGELGSVLHGKTGTVVRVCRRPSGLSFRSSSSVSGVVRWRLLGTKA